jgi:hypothetical protein
LHLLQLHRCFLLASAQSGQAAPVNYVFVPNTVVFFGETGTLSGTFTYDIATTTLTNIDVTLSGTAYAGTYDYTYDPWNTSNPTILGLMVDANSNQIDTHMLLLYFASNLDGSPGTTALTDAFGYNPQPVPGNNTLAVLSGGVAVAAATPLPAALPLFVSGLGALGLLGWRRKRKAATTA